MNLEFTPAPIFKDETKELLTLKEKSLELLREYGIRYIVNVQSDRFTFLFLNGNDLICKHTVRNSVYDDRAYRILYRVLSNFKNELFEPDREEKRSLLEFYKENPMAKSIDIINLLTD